MKPASIKDIAESLEVSKTLVSLVLNNKGGQYGISPVTQQKVKAKAKELNYSPNQLAQGLRLGKSKNIGLIVPDISNPFYSKISRYIGDLIDKKGYNLTIYNTDEDIEKEKRLIKNLLERNVDGLILASTSMNNKELKELSKNKIPYVLVDRFVDGFNTNFVGVDNYQGTKEAIDYLIDKGFKRIGFISVGPDSVSSLGDRKKAYLETLKKRNISYNKDFDLMVSYNNLVEEISDKLELMFKADHKPDALFIANNKLAIESLIKLKKLNVSIPKDLSLVCFDDIPMLDILPFPVSTVAQPIQGISAEAIRILFEEIENEGEQEFNNQQVILSAKLIKR